MRLSANIKMEFQTRSLAGGTVQHPTFKSAWDLYKLSRTGDDEESQMMQNAGMYSEYPEHTRSGLIWKISFGEHRWVRIPMCELLVPENRENQIYYLAHHEDEIRQHGIPALMEDISQRRIQKLCELSDTFTHALEIQDLDLVFWIDQPLDSIEQSLYTGFLEIHNVLTEDEFRAMYAPTYLDIAKRCL